MHSKTQSSGKNPSTNKSDDNPKPRKIKKPSEVDIHQESESYVDDDQPPFISSGDVFTTSQSLNPTGTDTSSDSSNTQSPTYNIPPTLEELNTTSYDHEKTIHLLKEQVPLNDKQIQKTIQKDKEDDDQYPIEALIGSHLITAIAVYKRHSDKLLAFEAMVNDLMEDEKITSKSVAKLVANWLCKTYIGGSVITSPTLSASDSGGLSPPLDGNLFEWLETSFNVNLKRCFEALVDQPYKPPEQAIQGFYNRKGFTYRIEELVNKNLTHFHTNKKGAALRKDSFLYGILTNGTGNGKSRACNEIQNIILNMQIKQTNVKYRKLHSYISLDNGSSITSLESKINPNNEITEGKIVGIRLLAKILGISTIDLVKKLGIHFTTIFNTCFFTLDNIVKKFKEFLNENEILIWSISFDEVQNLCTYFGDSWKLPFYSIGNFMVNTESVNERLNSNICLIPILSGIKYDGLKFLATEYGNQELSLPPLLPSNLSDILENFFKGKTFSCNSSLIELLKIGTKQVIKSMGIMLLEALIIPQVLYITLITIQSFMKSITLAQWKNQSTVLFNKLKEQVDEHVNNYIQKDTVFNNREFNKLFLSRLLCGLQVNLTDEEQELFKSGYIYMTKSKRLYIAPLNFQKVIQTDSYIFSKLPNTKTDLDPRNFERIDLKCLCYRLQILAQQDQITLESIFPFCVTGSGITYFTLSSKLEFNIVDHYETFITKNKDQFEIDCSKCKRKPQEVYTYTSNTHPCVDAHFTLETDKNQTCIFLLQHRHYDINSTLSVIDWLDHGNFADNAVTAFEKEKIKVFFVMITTTTLSDPEIERLNKHKHYERSILIYHQKNPSLEGYFPTNLLPYYKSFLFFEDHPALSTEVYSQEQDEERNRVEAWADLSQFISNLKFFEE